MADLGKTLKQEISRLAKKETRGEMGPVRKTTAQYRRDIATLKRQVEDQERRLEFLEKQEKRRVEEEEAPAEKVEQARFSVKGLRSHRKKLGLSAADYAQLVGVSPLTIYNWEGGKTRPRKAQLASLLAVRDLGVREARHRLELFKNGDQGGGAKKSRRTRKNGQAKQSDQPQTTEQATEHAG